MKKINPIAKATVLTAISFAITSTINLKEDTDYFSPNTNSTEAIKEELVLAGSGKGFIILGGVVVVIGTIISIIGSAKE